MNKKFIENIIKRLGIVLAIFIPYCLVFHPAQFRIHIIVSAVVAAVSFLLAGVVIKRRREKWVYSCAVAVTVAITVAIGIIPSAVQNFSLGLNNDFDNIQTDYFSNKNIMIIVPHQDDDLNLAQGMIEQYTNDGSKVSVVFCTNGDFFGIAETRVKEALKVMENCGVPNEDIYILGFGDQWTPMEIDGQVVSHIYNSPDENLVWTSRFGENKTYGTADKDCYMELAYTRSGYVNSLARIICDIKPDVIYATDTDAHIDHRAVSFFFEEAMAQVLKEETDYQPQVFKGFCYPTAWYAPDDFTDSLNLLSTTENFAEADSKPYYLWDSRLRVPVYNKGISRFLSKADGYSLLAMYESQTDARMKAPGIINGDKVFWQRRTDSLLYNADITTGNESSLLLNDFKLLDNGDISQAEMTLGVADVTDGVTVTLPQPAEISCIGLYDNPSPENNILSGVITLDNGEKIQFAQLDTKGCGTYINIPQTTVKSFTIDVTHSEGMAGLMEIEAYSQPYSQPEAVQYLMLTDEQDNFVYDYVAQDSISLGIYSWPGQLSIDDAEILLTGDGEYTVKDGRLIVTTEKGKSCFVTVKYGDVSCTAKISNPSAVNRFVARTLQKIDRDICFNRYTCYSFAGQVEFYKDYALTMINSVLSVVSRII